MTRRAPWIGLLSAAACALALCPGCGSLPFAESASSLSIRSQVHRGARLTTRFNHAVFASGDDDTLTIVLVGGPPERPTQAAVIRMFWRPEAGDTPITPTATNATIQYVIFAPSPGGEVGVYSGAGFLFPSSRPGNATLRAGLWHANLRLADRSLGFDDRLLQSVVSGEIVATRDPAAVTDLLHRLSTRVTQRLGYPRLVDARH